MGLRVAYLLNGTPNKEGMQRLEQDGFGVLAGSGYFSEVGTELGEPEAILRLIVDEEELGGWTTFFCVVTLGVVPARIVRHLTATGELRSADGEKLSDVRVEQSLTQWVWIGFAPTFSTVWNIALQRHQDDIFRSVLVQLLEQGAI
ncbi:MAG: hypothetical protein JRG86_06255 [Deltaproteobacteria bacterium]|nr:hypothetical protein [Deltaproteobacteria bacterium]